MMFFKLIVSSLLNGLIISVDVDEEMCSTSFPQDFSICSMPTPPKESCVPSVKPFCQLPLTAVQINFTTYKDILELFLLYSVINCCGACKDITTTKLYPSTIELTESINNKTLTSSFVYPILGTKSTTHLYQYYFLPVFEVTKATLMTLKPTGEEIITALIISCLKLWPLLLIIMLMALNSGCIIWALDTWKNEEEFPRNFFHGFYEGFWWAFISMTTVGYGDKTAHSFAGRVFAIFWILIGITIFSMLTATLTSVIQDATLPPSTDIAGKKMAIMKHNLLDATLVLNKGGIVHEEITIDELYPTLLSGRVYGLITDFLSTTSARKFVKGIDDLFVFQEIDYSSNEFAYGILIRNESDFKYMKQFLNENGMLFKSCLMQGLNNRNSTISMAEDLFHPNHGMFWVSLISLLVAFLLIFTAGTLYELYKRKFKPKKIDEKKKTEIDLADEITNIVDVWNKNKKEDTAMF